MAEVIFFVTETTDFNTFKEIVENNNMNYCVTTNANELHKLLREKNQAVFWMFTGQTHVKTLSDKITESVKF